MTCTVNGEPVIPTGEISRRLGMTIPVELLKSCGISPMHESRTGCYWRASDFRIICFAICRHIELIGGIDND